jgi:hypothetical protein
LHVGVTDGATYSVNFCPHSGHFHFVDVGFGSCAWSSAIACPFVEMICRSHTLHYSTTRKELFCARRAFLRSFAVSPPQTPYSSCFIAWARHCGRTTQDAQISFASRTSDALWSLKKNSCLPAHAARSRQSRSAFDTTLCVFVFVILSFLL